MYNQEGTATSGEMVDQDVRVKGVEGLRVTGASVFPSSVRGHP